MRNARFWIWHNDGWVKLTLRPGQKLEFTYGGEHEEGWSRTETTYEYDEEAGVVVCITATRSQDCDGPHSDYAKVYSPLHALKARSMFEECGRWMWDEFSEQDVVIPSSSDYGIYAPEWFRVESHQRDYYAESMGY